MATKKETERQEAVRFLTVAEDGPKLAPGDVVYCVLRHRSQSGMMRVIDLFVIRKDRWSGKPHPWFIGFRAAKALGDVYDRERQGIRIGGCGMDMGFHLVYSLSSVLFPGGFGEVGYKLKAGGLEIDRATGKRPKSKRALAAMLKAGYVFHGRNGDRTGWDSCGGYALKQEWV